VKVGVLPTSLRDDPNHWHDRAKEARALANQEHDPIAKAMILQIADDYDRLAVRAAVRSGGRAQSSGGG
jgi:hypothetical protein